MLSILKRQVGRQRRLWHRHAETRWGVDFISELKQRLSNMSVRVIFDVGAHIGMTALEFSDQFPLAKVHAFEPIAENMRRLHSNLIGKPEILRFPFALGETIDSKTMFIDPQNPSMARFQINGGERVQIDTLDNFCQRDRIGEIDILKIDTEGHELQVLRGGKDMLLRNAIGVIKAECAIDPDSNYHTQLADLCDYLHPLGYRLFGIYDQWEDTLKPTARIRRLDVAFISPRYF